MLSASVLLLVYPLAYRHLPFLQAHFRTYHFFEQFLIPPADAETTVPLPDTLVTDSIAVALPPPKYDGQEYLAPFYRALRMGSEQIRIAHYGDSSIEGDLISASFRDSLQRRFGGGGVGFVPIVNPISGFRRSLLHSFSNNWNHCNLAKKNVQGLPRGLAGEYFSTWIPPDTTTAQADSLAADSTLMVDRQYWTFYRSSSLFPGTGVFPSSRLFYGAPVPDPTGSVMPPGSVKITSGGATAVFLMNGENTVNESILNSLPSRNLRLTFSIPPGQPVYGVSLESSDGVIVDNFPSRGNIGTALLYIASSTLADFQEKLDYDLVMLQFGINALNPKMSDYSWYEREMVKVIRHFQKSMPGTAILLLGPSDRALKINGRMQSDPSVARVTEALRRAAERTNSTFFSFYEAMGGEGSMVEWVENRQPRLGNLDYTHFNFSGAREAAMLLLDFLLTGYEQSMDTSDS